MPLVRMKAAPVKTDGERLGNEFMNGVFFSAHIGIMEKKMEATIMRLYRDNGNANGSYYNEVI